MRIIITINDNKNIPEQPVGADSELFESSCIWGLLVTLLSSVTTLSKECVGFSKYRELLINQVGTFSLT